ncbi:MAG: OsmC family protein [Acidobacteria bacterium]|nr:OsmC family protein [Acidobacteriota bacterium]
MKVTVKHLGNVGFEAEARGHRLVCDQPETNRGMDQGMTPPELMLSSLGTCAAYYAVEYLRTRNLPLDGLEVTVEAEKAAAPARIGTFRILVHVPELEQRHQEGVLRAVKSCLIHNTLLHAPAIEIALAVPAAL